MQMYHFLVVFYPIFWCHVISAENEMAFMLTSLVDGEQFNVVAPSSGNREKRSDQKENFQSIRGNDGFEFHFQDSSSHHHVTKRESQPELSYFSQAYCKKLGFCGLDPKLSIVCLVKCNFNGETLLQPFLGLIPELPNTLCKAVSTLFTSLPQHVRLNNDKLPNLNYYLSSLNVNSEDEADFAKTAANALTVTMIKNVQCPIFDALKPAIKKLEIRDADKKLRKTVGFFGKGVGSLLGTSTGLTGQFVNPKCDQTNLDDEALLLISAMKTRKCIMDILMPGYFVFNAAPKVASNHKIAPLLRAWNMPLVMFTGVKCCMVQYALRKFRSKCTHNYNLLEKPHGLPSKTGPDTVCNSIPVFTPLYLATLKIPSSLSAIASPGASSSSNNTAIDITKPDQTAIASPCGKKNKNDLEECATESATVDYSEEATKANVETTTKLDEEIKSDEKDY